MAQTTLTYKDASGATQTLEASEGASYKIPNNRLCDASGNFTPAGDAAARARYNIITDGTDSLGINDVDGALDERSDVYAQTASCIMAIDSAASAGSQLVPLNVVSTAAPWLKVALFNSTNQMPAMDAAARAGYVSLTDGTDTLGINDIDGALDERLDQYAMTVSGLMAIDAAASAGSQLVPLNVVSTAAPWLKVSHFNSTNQMPAGDAVARVIYQATADGTTGPVAVKAASTGAALTDKALVVNVSPNDAASKGSKVNLDETVTAVKASAGVLRKVTVVNNQAATAFIQLWDLATGDVTIGTTAPNWQFQVAANSTLSVDLDLPFGTATSIASSTAASGGTGSNDGVLAYWKYN